MASALANLWSCAAWVAANEHIASITPAISLELAWTYSGECCYVNDGPGVSVAAAAVVCGGGDGGDICEAGLLSTSGSGA